MSTRQSGMRGSVEQALRMVDLSEAALAAGSLEEFAKAALPVVAEMGRSDWSVLYVVDSQLPRLGFYQHGLAGERVDEIEKLCAEHFKQLSDQTDRQSVSVSADAAGTMGENLILYALRSEAKCVGLLGLRASEATAESAFLDRVLSLLASGVCQLIEREKSKMQLTYLNTYLNVSSLLAQALDLHESLEVALQCCMEEVSAEAGSVLLLDEEKEKLRFYNVEGPAKQVLMTATFPADRGLAGAILRTQESEVINDVRNDPRFYGQIDSESGFTTRNMIAMPLTAGQEPIGVLEVLNKADGGSFTEEERLVLLSIAEEIAFAIRNAKLFDYVVNSYCKQRQGQSSCKGCKRPLGSWTPCVKYRETGV